MVPTKPTEQDRPRFSTAIDRRIVAGYLDDRKSMFAELGLAGFPKAAIIKRGDELGLSASFLSKCKADGVTLTVRECLSCEQPFVSIGAQNRRCKRCRSKS